MPILPRRKSVPHWDHLGGTVFLNWNLKRGQPPLTHSEREVVLNVIRRGEGVVGHLLAGVVMDDHVHVLVTLDSQVRTPRVAQVWKSASAHHIVKLFGRRTPVWQRDYLDRWLWDPERIRRCIWYINQNPIRRWPGVEDYPWMIGGEE
jgi:REP element-mobilizing transposase RayT